MRNYGDGGRLLAAATILVLLAGCSGGASPTQMASPRAAAIATASPTASPAATPTQGRLGAIGAGRQIHSSTVLADGRVLVAGGYDVNDLALASAALFDPRSNRFSQTGSMRAGRGYHTATLLANGRVLVAGGGPASWVEGKEGPFLASAELYDPTTGTFSPTGSMATAREGHSATLLRDGRVLIAGGDDNVVHAVARAELYDPKTGTFSPTGSMVTARSFQTATLLSDGRVLITGGSPAMWTFDEALASAEIYDPKTGTFSSTGPMASGRAWHAATLLTDGRVLVTGGQTNHTELASAELYDPKTGTFTATSTMTVPRVYQTAKLLVDGRVLVAGGGGDYVGFKFLASAELYDPKTDGFSSTGSLTYARTYQAASRLADGRVLVTGGYGVGAPLATAEIYDPATGTFAPAG